jgi:precorrin-6A/cobalt-precorrin-6A reductase
MSDRILILGGTTEARQLAGALSGLGTCDVLLSLAGRTRAPLAQPVPTRIGGFGGVDGLAQALRKGRFDLLIDATHPFAERISNHAALAARQAGVPVFALRRPPWTRVTGDIWTCVDDIDGAVAALAGPPKTVLLAIGRQEAARFERVPQHSYIVRSVDPVTPPLDLPRVDTILATGPFAQTDEEDLLRRHDIQCVVAKNSGGAATYGKIAAARALAIPVILIERGPAADMPTVDTVEAALARIAHDVPPGRKRGV